MPFRQPLSSLFAFAACLSLGGVTTRTAHAQTMEPPTPTQTTEAQPGLSRLDGVVLAVLPERSEVVLKVSRIRDQNGHVSVLAPPRAKPVILRQLDDMPSLAIGDAVQVTGRDLGRGRPLRASQVTLGVAEEEVSGDDTTEEAAPPHAAAPRKVAHPLVPAPTKRPGTLAARGHFDRAALARAKRQVSARGAASSAFIVLPDGTRVEGRRLLTLQATGYGPEDNGIWGDRTKLGTTVGYGTVAVDPRVIPLGTRLWVEGYGFCIALDTGSAIKGQRIDLGHDNEEDAEQVGRKKVRVLILN